jgi:ABC-type transport system involved in multi-copper enzyme maturation permease subunit
VIVGLCLFTILLYAIWLGTRDPYWALVVTRLIWVLCAGWVLMLGAIFWSAGRWHWGGLIVPPALLIGFTYTMAWVFRPQREY